MADHNKGVHLALSYYTYTSLSCLTQALKQSRACHMSLEPVSWAQCQLFCICWAYIWHSTGAAGTRTKSEHPSHAVPVNRSKMQVLCDIAAVTVQLIDWCCSCCNGITWPVRSEIHEHSVCSWCFMAAWTMKSVRSFRLHKLPFQQSGWKEADKNRIGFVFFCCWFFFLNI